jgi:predicted DCC family thiol-disulfide oxidoreductase YuxK
MVKHVKEGSQMLESQSDYPMLLTDLRGLVHSARAQAAASVNSELVMLYWHVGQRIQQSILEQERADYGQRIVIELAKALTAEFGQGFNRSSLFRMVQFAEVCPDLQIVATLWRQLSWSHIRELLPLKDPLQRDFYAQMATLERWSVRTMRERMNTLLFERTALSKQSEIMVKAELERLRFLVKSHPIWSSATRTFCTFWVYPTHIPNLISRMPFCTILKRFCSRWVQALPSWHDRNAFRWVRQITVWIYCCTTVVCGVWW